MDFERIATAADMYRADSSYLESIMIQLIKLQEELGEVAEAYIGATGKNPRKGFTHTFDDLSDEIIDVIITGHVALATVMSDLPWQDIEAYFKARVNRTFNRAGIAARAAEGSLEPEIGGAGVPFAPRWNDQPTPPDAPLPTVHPTNRVAAEGHSRPSSAPWPM